MTVSTGVGGGIVIDGSIYHGAGGRQGVRAYEAPS